MTAATSALPAFMTRSDTIYVRLSRKNGIERIRAGESEDQVIRGGWAVALENALRVRRLIVLNPDGTIRRVLHATYSHHVVESSTPQKRPITRAFFDIEDDCTVGHLIGRKSPLFTTRNPVRYGKP